MKSDGSILEYEKEDFKESIKSLKHDEIDWLLKRLVRQYPELKGYEKDQNKEWKLLSRANQILYGINKNKPTDIRTYVEKYLKEKEYDKKLSELERHIWHLELGEDEKYDKHQKELQQLLAEANKELPGYSDSRGKQISEIRGDIYALRSGGKRGSTRMVQKITFEQMAMEEAEKEKKTKKNKRGE